jgi:hypothetical protein
MAAPSEAKSPGLLRRLVSLQVERPWVLLLIAIVLTIPSIVLARRLELRTGFESLLPENKASVKELKRVGERTAGQSTLTVVADASPDGSDKKALQRFGDDLVGKLRALGPDWVGSAEDGVQAEQEFLRRRKGMFLSIEKVRELHEKIVDRYNYEVNGGLDDPPEPITRATIEKQLGIEKQAAAKPGDKPPSEPPYPDGYYMDAAGGRLVVLIRTPVVATDLKNVATLRGKVEAAVAELKPTSYAPKMTVAYTGDIVTASEQYGAVKGDLLSVGASGILMILLVDYLFFLRVRAVMSMALAIGVGVLWTFAITKLAIGHLNTASGFLVSIVFGNGINNGILLRARFNEERRLGHSMIDAIETAYRGTWRPTLTATAAAGASYLSLATTDFRGFKHFGAIGGYGMLLCWIANYLFMAPLLVIFERIWPSHAGEAPKPGLIGRIRTIIDHGIPFGAPFARVIRIAPRLTAAVGVVVGVAAIGLSVRYVRQDPMEYDTGKLGNREGTQRVSPAQELAEEVGKVTGRSGVDGMAIMVDRPDQVKPLKAALMARWNAAPQDKKPFEKIVGIYDLIPEEQAEKVELLTDLRKKINRVHELGKMSEADWKELEPNLPPADLTTFEIKDLPERVARPFTEKDGTRGRIVYIVPRAGRSVKDVHYLLLWADSYRETKLPSGETIIGSGRAVIFADMLSAVIEDSPKAMVLSFAMTALVVVFAFIRGKRGVLSTALVLGSLVLGVAWMGAALALFKVKINFLNFIAVPITFGIGVDYAVNVIHRWRAEGKGSVVRVVRETGGAVVLCSMTTTLGYLALLGSINGAVRSFGLAAVIGEVTCLFAALVILPGILIWLDGGFDPIGARQPSPAASEEETSPAAAS